MRIISKEYLRRKNLLKKEGGLRKRIVHCRDCKHNFRVPVPTGKATPNGLIYCPRCGGNRVSKGWIQEEKQEPSTVNAKIEMFMEVGQ